MINKYIFFKRYCKKLKFKKKKLKDIKQIFFNFLTLICIYRHFVLKMKLNSIKYI